MMATFLVGEIEGQIYKQNCEEYDDIINMFKELGTGKLDRRYVLDNVKNIVKNGLVEKIEDLVDDIEYYENR